MENGNKTDFVLFSKGTVWMILEFDRFGIVKDKEEETKTSYEKKKTRYKESFFAVLRACRGGILIVSLLLFLR